MFQTTAKKAMFLAIAGVASATAVVNCSGNKSNEGAPTTGVLSMALKLSNGVNVNSVDYKISGGVPPLAAPITGSVDVSDPAATLSFFVGGIPTGTGYVMDLTAKSSDNKTTCAGKATFAVEAGKTTLVSVQLQCRADVVIGNVAVNGTTNNCPVITSQVIAPQAVSVGGKISVGATASDLDATDVLTFAWTGGTFDAASTASTKFTCTSGGVKTLTLSISDGKCTTTAAVDVSCIAVSCGNGTLETALGEQCEPPGVITAGVNCSAECQIIPVCGNGKVEAGESCDPPNQVSGGANTCSATCQAIPVVCGNGLVQPGEACDSGVAGGNASCSATCTLPKAAVCPDGIKDPGEECDAGPAGSATCTPACKTIVVASPCDTCEATSCDATTSGCALYTGARKDACLAWVACMRTTKCSVNGTDPQKCYCGTASDSKCLGGGGTGLCKAQAEAAAELTPCAAPETADECAERRATDVAVRFRDQSFPIGGGTNLIFCDGASCSMQCTL